MTGLRWMPGRRFGSNRTTARLDPGSNSDTSITLGLRRWRRSPSFRLQKPSGGAIVTMVEVLK